MLIEMDGTSSHPYHCENSQNMGGRGKENDEEERGQEEKAGRDERVHEPEHGDIPTCYPVYFILPSAPPISKPLL